jgi:hypothetical protein
MGIYERTNERISVSLTNRTVQTMALLVASHEQGGNVGLANFDVNQQLKQLEDDILDATLALKATRSCVEDMGQFLAGVGGQEQNHHVTTSVASEMQSDIYKELALLLDRADSLRQKLRSSIGMVSLRTTAPLKEWGKVKADDCDGTSSYLAFSTLRAATRYNNSPERRGRRTRKWKRSPREA